MKIETKFLGEIEIIDQDIITFEFGLLGFPNMKKFVIIPIDAEHPLTILQSIEDSALGFIMAYPFIFKPDYAFDISDEDKSDLQIEKVEDVQVYSIVTLKESFPDSTLNLLAPVVLNVNKKQGKQIVLQDNKAYPLRYPMKSLEGSVK